MIHYIFDLDDTLIMHNNGIPIEYEMIQSDTKLNFLLSKCNGECYIYTNGTYGHGVGVVENLKIGKHVIEIFARDTIPFMKPYAESFDYVKSKIQEQMQDFTIEYLFFDDLLDNLRTAKGIGWTTIWINPNASSKERYVDYSFSNIYQALLYFNLKKL